MENLYSTIQYNAAKFYLINAHALDKTHSHISFNLPINHPNTEKESTYVSLTDSRTSFTTSVELPQGNTNPTLNILLLLCQVKCWDLQQTINDSAGQDVMMYLYCITPSRGLRAGARQCNVSR